MNTAEMTTTRGKDQFYPTPRPLAEKMLSGLDMDHIQSVLEPSAGKGDLIDAIAKKNAVWRYHGRKLDVDFCEIDPYLRQICKYNFSEEKEEEIRDEYRPIDSMCAVNRTESQKEEYKRLRFELDVLNNIDVHCVNDDFLTYRTYKHYDLILMNPPFANGDEHLLRAIEMQVKQG